MPSIPTALKDRLAREVLADKAVGDPLVKAICLDTGLDPNSEDYLKALDAFQKPLEQYPRNVPVTVGQVLVRIPGIKTTGAVGKLLLESEPTPRVTLAKRDDLTVEPLVTPPNVRRLEAQEAAESEESAKKALDKKAQQYLLDHDMPTADYMKALEAVATGRD